MPRQLVADAVLPRALALRQSGSQLVSMIGGPVGGALVALAGFAAASLTDSISFAVVLVALIAIKPRFAPPAAPRRNILRESADGVRVALTTPGLGAVLLLVAGVAGFILPATSLLVPLITRQHHWTVTVAGVIVGAQAAGVIAVALLVARRGSAPRPGLAAALGLTMIAAGELAIGLSHFRVQAVAGAAVMGLGTGVFVCNLGPVLMGTSPRSHLARVQALLSLAQSGAVLVFYNLLGAIAHTDSATGAMLTCAAVVLACALAAVLAPPIRRIGPPGPPVTQLAPDTASSERLTRLGNSDEAERMA
jgi:MFS transporter